MDIASILMISLVPVLVTYLPLLLVVAAFNLYRPIITGWFGERKIRTILDGLNSKQYRSFHDVLLPINGETTQIDHVVFAGGRCFVIETKAHDGWIYGSANQKNWTQTFNKRSKFPFQNPIRQNHKHILAVRDVVGDLTVTGVVVFTRGTFKSDRIEAVLYSKELKRFLLDNAKANSVMNEGAVQSLMKIMIVEGSAHRAHVRRLQAKYGGRWRIPVAHTLMIAALCLYLFGTEIESATKSSGPTVQGKNQTVTPNRIRVPQQQPNSVQKKVAVQKERVPIPRVSGFTAGKVIVIESGEYLVLNIGDKTRDGWELLAADAKNATFSHSSGEKTSIQIK